MCVLSHALRYLVCVCVVTCLEASSVCVCVLSHALRHLVCVCVVTCLEASSVCVCVLTSVLVLCAGPLPWQPAGPSRQPAVGHHSRLPQTVCLTAVETGQGGVGGL